MPVEEIVMSSCDVRVGSKLSGTGIERPTLPSFVYMKIEVPGRRTFIILLATDSSVDIRTSYDLSLNRFQTGSSPSSLPSSRY